jgi:hypothetical protein
LTSNPHLFALKARRSGWAAKLSGKAPTPAKVQAVGYDDFNLGIKGNRSRQAIGPTTEISNANINFPVNVTRHGRL